jgi:lysophospholipase L1-like esterase
MSQDPRSSHGKARRESTTVPSLARFFASLLVKRPVGAHQAVWTSSPREVNFPFTGDYLLAKGVSQEIEESAMASRFQVLCGCLITACVTSAPVFGQQQPQQQRRPATRPAQTEKADQPWIKDGGPGTIGFVSRHEGFLNDLKAHDGKVGILFVGDSITDGWRGRGKDVFEKTYGSMDPYNIGIGGDRTEHVIWRLQHGEIEGISPKVAVLMIGTNNLGVNTNEEIVKGVTKCVKILNDKLPATRLLLLAIFPRDPKPDAERRTRINAINEELAKLDDGGQHVKYLDIGKKFLEPDGTLTREIMPDFLHPNEKGYQIWADATAPAIAELMK